MLPGSATGSRHLSRALYQHRENPKCKHCLGNNKFYQERTVCISYPIVFLIWRALHMPAGAFWLLKLVLGSNDFPKTRQRGLGPLGSLWYRQGCGAKYESVLEYMCRF